MGFGLFAFSFSYSLEPFAMSALIVFMRNGGLKSSNWVSYAPSHPSFTMLNLDNSQRVLISWNMCGQVCKSPAILDIFALTTTATCLYFQIIHFVPIKWSFHFQYNFFLESFLGVLLENCCPGFFIYSSLPLEVLIKWSWVLAFRN